MNWELEQVRQARKSFDRILQHKVYTEVIRDDGHLALLLELIQGGCYKSILDIGTGTGYLAFPLAEIYPEALVFGIDIAGGIIDKNRERVIKEGKTNLVFQTFNGIEYPFEEGSFDLVVSRYAFHHFPNPESAVRQISRLLCLGGKVMLSDPVRAKKDQGGIIDAFMKIKKDGHIRFYTEEELERMFAQNGLHKEKQIFTHMAFPFAQGSAYSELYGQLMDKDRLLYDIVEENGVIWVRHIAVGNTVFKKI